MPTPQDAGPSTARQRGEPAVVMLTEGLDRQSVAKLGNLLRNVPRSRTVIVDVTDIPAFDSEGTSGLLALQETIGPDRLVVVGVREAAARLLALDDLQAEASTNVRESDVDLHRPRLMPGLLMVAPADPPSVPALRTALTAAIARGISIVIADLAPYPTPSGDLLDVLTGAQQQAAQRGEEFVLINVSEEAATALRQAGLAATTHLAKAH